MDDTSHVPNPPPAPIISKTKCNMVMMKRKGKCFLKELEFKLVGAMESNNFIEVQKLIHKGVNLNCIILIHKTPLIYSIERRTPDVSIPEILIEAGADLELPEKVARRRRPIHLAVMSGSLELVHKLLQYGVNINGRDGADMTPLHYACYYGFQDIVSELISRGCDLFTGDVSGRTAIHRAIESKHYDVAEVLLSNGVPVDTKDRHGWTPLFQSILFSDITSVKYLLNRGASVNCREVDGNAPLHLAGDPLGRGFVRVVLTSSVDYYKRTRRIPTPELQALFIQERCGSLKIVQLLVNAGADVNARNKAEANPAQSTRNADIIIYLLTCGSRLSSDTIWNLELQGETDSVNKITSSKAFLEQLRLMRLCRNVIRQSVAKSRNINSSLLQLPLPDKLSQYLCLVYDEEN